MNFIPLGVGDMNQAEARRTLLARMSKLSRLAHDRTSQSRWPSWSSGRVMELLSHRSVASHAGALADDRLPQPSSRVGKLFARR
jgi:hypothetical protein